MALNFPFELYRGHVRFAGPAIALLAVFLVVDTGYAYSDGAPYQGCGGCHAGGTQPPTVTISTLPETLTPGSEATLVLSFKGNGNSVGFYLDHGGEGELALLPGENIKFADGKLTHARPLNAVAGVAEARFKWTPPAENGGTDFDVYFISADGNRRTSGDEEGHSVLSVVYGCTGTRYYQDFDNDGFGSSDFATTLDCEQPEGWAPLDGDCNENDSSIHPNAEEVCNEKDDNCDGNVDEGTSPRKLYIDKDGDGYGAHSTMTMLGCVPPEGFSDNSDDCNDINPDINPAAMEICNGLDDNCNRREDEGVRLICGVGTCQVQAPCFSTTCTPGAPSTEICNGFDDDCDGVIDNGDLCPEGETCHIYRCVPDEEANTPSPSDPSEPSSSPEPDTLDPAMSGTPNTPAAEGQPPEQPPTTPAAEASSGCTFSPSEPSRSYPALAWLAFGWLLSRRRRP